MLSIDNMYQTGIHGDFTGELLGKHGCILSIDDRYSFPPELEACDRGDYKC